MSGKPKSLGRPSKYRPEFDVVARKIAELGGLDEDIAAAIGVTRNCVWRWRRLFPSFKEACAIGKEVADSEVEASLYRLATGFERDAEQVTVTPSGQVIRVPIVEYIKPCSRSAIHWLACRKPQIWPRDPKSTHVTIDLGSALEGADGLQRAHAAVLSAMGAGVITAQQASDMAKVIDAAGASLERGQLANDVKLLEVEGPKK